MSAETSSTRVVETAHRNTRSTFLFVLVSWIWGSTWLAIKFGLAGVPPFIGAGIRMAISGVFLVGVALAMRIPWPRGRTYLAHIATQGTLSFGLQYALVYWSEQTVPSGLVAVLFAVNPLLTSLLAALVFRIEKLAAIQVVGLVLGFCGVGIIFWSEVVAAAHAPAAGAAAVLAASALSAISLVVAKRYAHDVPPIATVGPGQLIGSLVLGTLALCFERGQAVNFGFESIAALVYLTVFGSAIAFLAYFTLVRDMAVTKLSLSTYITPVIAVLLGILLGHEQIAVSTIGGAACVIAGIGLVHTKPKAVLASPSRYSR